MCTLDWFLNAMEKGLKQNLRAFEKVWKDPKRWDWYQLIMSFMAVASTGVRGGEAYVQRDNDAYSEYGWERMDYMFIWRKKNEVGLYQSNKNSLGLEDLHHLKLALRNTKGAKVGETVYIRVGSIKSKSIWDPCSVLFRFYQDQRT
eukprot:1072945_1